jgi:hypothetical protein
MSEADDITRALLEGTLGIAEHGLAERVERPEGPFSLPCSQCARRVTQDFVTIAHGAGRFESILLIIRHHGNSK